MKTFRPLFAVIILCLFESISQGQTTQEAPHPIEFIGMLERVDEKTLLIQLAVPKAGQTEVTVPIDNATRFRIDFEAATLDDLKRDMDIQISERPRVGLRILALSPSISGTISKIEGKTFTLKVDQPGGKSNEIRVQTDDSTCVIALGTAVQNDRPKPKAVDDLATGMHITVVPQNGKVSKIIVSAFHAHPTTQTVP